MPRLGFFLCCVAASGLWILALGKQQASSNATVVLKESSAGASVKNPEARVMKAELEAEKNKLGLDICSGVAQKVAGKNVPPSPAGNLTKAALANEGPKKVTVTEKRREEFPDNVVKEVTVKEKVEKLPSNDTKQKTVVERKTIRQKEGADGKPKKEVTVEKEVERKVSKNNTDKVAGGKGKEVMKDDIEKKIHELEEKTKVMDKEIKEGKCTKEVKVQKTPAEAATGKIGATVAEEVIPKGNKKVIVAKKIEPKGEATEAEPVEKKIIKSVVLPNGTVAEKIVPLAKTGETVVKPKPEAKTVILETTPESTIAKKVTPKTEETEVVPAEKTAESVDEIVNVVKPNGTVVKTVIPATETIETLAKQKAEEKLNETVLAKPDEVVVKKVISEGKKPVIVVETKPKTDEVEAEPTTKTEGVDQVVATIKPSETVAGEIVPRVKKLETLIKTKPGDKTTERVVAEKVAPEAKNKIIMVKKTEPEVEEPETEPSEIVTKGITPTAKTGKVIPEGKDKVITVKTKPTTGEVEEVPVEETEEVVETVPVVEPDGSVSEKVVPVSNKIETLVKTKPGDKTVDRMVAEKVAPEAKNEVIVVKKTKPKTDEIEEIPTEEIVETVPSIKTNATTAKTSVPATEKGEASVKAKPKEKTDEAKKDDTEHTNEKVCKCVDKQGNLIEEVVKQKPEKQKLDSNKSDE